MTTRINWLLLINAMLGNFLGGLSARIFMISLPSVANGLGTDILGIAWALISFQITGVSFAIVFGRLGDIYGRQTIYGLGFIVLTVGSFLCGVSQDALQLTSIRKSFSCLVIIKASPLCLLSLLWRERKEVRVVPSGSPLTLTLSRKGRGNQGLTDQNYFRIGVNCLSFSSRSGGSYDPVRWSR